MAVSDLKLYDALKADMTEESARLLVEAVSFRPDVATRSDIDGVRGEIDGVRREIAGLRKEFTRWILAFFLPLWVTAVAAIITNLMG